MLSYVDEKLRFVVLAIPNNMLYNICQSSSTLGTGSTTDSSSTSS